MPNGDPRREVQSLVSFYRQNPNAFTDDEVDQLEKLTNHHDISFSPLRTDFSLMSTLGQIGSGFVQGMTTIGVGDKPKNTYESIAHSIGHLAGFAPAMLALPIKGLALAAQGLRLGTVAKAGVTGTGLANKIMGATKGAQILNKFSIPMIASRHAKTKVDDVIAKSAKNIQDIFIKGSAKRAITEEAIGLGAASAVSNIWEGPDGWLNSFVGGSLAGGAFGGIGNFVRLNNIFKNGNPVQVKKAESVLKAAVGSSITGLPATLRGEPIETQIYEYLLGGFFGYQSRPAYQVEGGKLFINEMYSGKRNGNVFTPEDTSAYTSVHPKAQEYAKKQAHEGASKWLDRVAQNPERVRADIKDLAERNGISIEDATRRYAKAIYLAGIEVQAEESVKRTTKGVDADIGEQQDNTDSFEHYAPELRKIARYVKDPDQRSIIVNEVKTLMNEMDNPVDFINEFKKREFEKELDIEPEDVPNFLEGLTRQFIQRQHKARPELVIEIPKGEGQPANLLFHHPEGDYHGKKIGENQINVPSDYLDGNRGLSLRVNNLLNYETDSKGFGKDKVVTPHGTDWVDFQVKHYLGPKEWNTIQGSLHQKNWYIFGGKKDKDLLTAREYHIDSSEKIDTIVKKLDPRGDAGVNTSLTESRTLEADWLASKDRTLSKHHGAEHDKAWVSNVLYEAQRQGLYKAGSRDFSRLHELMTMEGSSKDVVDWNKRQQLYEDKSYPAHRSFYNGKKEFKYVLAEDTDILGRFKKDKDFHVSDTDGIVMQEQSIFDATLSAVGHPSDAGFAKHVYVTNAGKRGSVAVKPGVERASDSVNKWLKDNGVDFIIFNSAAKHTGRNPNDGNISKLSFGKDGTIKGDPSILSMPVEHLRVNLSTYENPKKFSGPQKFPLQLAGNLTEDLSPGIAKHFYDKYIKESIHGKAEYNNRFKTMSEADIIKEMDKDPRFIDKISFDLLHAEMLKNTKLSSKIARQIERMDIRGELDEIDGLTKKTDFADYEYRNKRLARALGHDLVARELFKYSRKDFQNTYRRYVLNRYMQPRYKYSGKAMLKSATPNVLFEASILEFKNNDILLDNGHKKMNVIFRPDKSGTKEYTLEGLWDAYSRHKKKDLSKVSNTVKKNHAEKLKDFEEALQFTVIRSPADSPSGIRILNFKGFTNQRGAGAITHDKANRYLGGADKDTDSIMMFQGFDKKIKDTFWNQRNQWEGKPAKSEKYNEEFLGTGWENKQKPYKSKASIFSPSMRKMVSRNASTGNAGLGYGLSSADQMLIFADWLKNKQGGKFTFKGKDLKEAGITKKDGKAYADVTIELRKDGIDNLREIKREIVNRSADAADFPTTVSYDKFPEILFKNGFKAFNHKGQQYDAEFGYGQGSAKGVMLKRIAAVMGAVKPKGRADGRGANFRDLQSALFEHTALIKTLEGIYAEGARTLMEDGIHTKVLPEQSFVDMANNLTPLRDILKKIGSKDLPLDKGLKYIKKHSGFFNETWENNMKLINEDIAAINEGKSVDYERFLDRVSDAVVGTAALNRMNKIAVEIRNTLKDPKLKSKAHKKVGVGLQSLIDDAFRIKKLSKNTERQEDNVIQTTDQIFDSKITTIKSNIDAALAGKYEGKTVIKLGSLYKEYFDLLMLSPFHGVDKKTGRSKTGIYRLPYQSESISTSSIMSLGKEMGMLFEGTQAKVKPEKLIYIESLKDLPKQKGSVNMDVPGAEIEHYKNKVKTDFDALDKDIEWEQIVYKSGFKQPRLTAYYGDKGTEYTYSGVKNKPKPWSPELLKLKKKIEKITGYKFNSAVVNKYRSGKDAIGFHPDNEPELTKEGSKEGPVIASVSFGSKRDFILKEQIPIPGGGWKAGKEIARFELGDGDVFLMMGGTQKNYVHGINKESTTDPRINVTFRRTNYGQEDPRVEIEPGAKAGKIVEDIVSPQLELFPSKGGTKPDVKKPLVDIDKLEFQSVSDEHVMAAREFRRILEDHPYMAEDFDAFWNRFSLETRGVVKDIADMDLNDMMAFNDYINSVKKKGFQSEFKKKYWLQDPRTNDKELVVGGIYDVYETYANPVPKKGGTSVQKKIRIALSPIGSMKEFQAKINREENAAADRIAKVLDERFKFRTDLDKEDQSLLMDIIINRREVARGQEEPITGRKDVASFLKKKIGNQTGAELVKEYDAKFTEYYETFGKEWIYTIDKDGKRVEWNRIDKDNKYGVINRYIKYDKNGRFDIDHFLSQVITSTDYKVKTPNKGVGLDGLLRYQYEQRLEDIILNENPKNPIKFREAYRSNSKTAFKSGIGYIDPDTYFSHINFGYNKKARAEYEASINALAEKNAQRATVEGKDPEKARNATLAFYGLVRDASMSSTGHFERAHLDSIIRNEEAGRIGFNKMPSTAKERTADLKGFDRRMSVLDKYTEQFIRSYYRNVMAIQGNIRINKMLKDKPFDKNPTDKKFHKEYLAKVKKAGYNSLSHVWGDFLKAGLRESLGRPSFFSDRMIMSIEKGDPLKLKKNPYYLTTDHAIARGFEYLEKKGILKKLPWVNNLPTDPKLRGLAISDGMRKLGILDAKYNLLTLLANTGSFTANVFGGTTMTIASAGLRPFVNSLKEKYLIDNMLQKPDGTWSLSLKDGSPVKTKKQLYTFLSEQGVIDTYIKNELEYNGALKSEGKKMGQNFKNFIKKATEIITKNPEVSDETMLDLAKRYELSDKALKAGGWFMQKSERINRLNAFLSHAIKAKEGLGREGADIRLDDAFLFDAGMRGIENTQFLYHNSFRPAFMRTSLGRVLSRFKLFVFQSVRARKEFFRQAKATGFKEGTPEYEKFKNLFVIDLLTFAMASAYPYSLFDNALPPPWDWMEETSDLLFGNKRERDQAFFGTLPRPIAPLQIAIPPIARIPGAMAELVNGDWDRFADYTVHNLYPFGRLYKQIDKTIKRPERVMENFFKIPVHDIKNQIKRERLVDLKRKRLDELSETQ